MGLPKNGFPGDGYMYVICDICGRKVRQKDTVVRKDKFNQQNNLVVCKHDVDTPQPSLRPIRIRERYRPVPNSVRGEPDDHYVTNVNASRVPSAPQMLQATVDSLTGYVRLTWLGPIDPGDSAIIGYVVYKVVQFTDIPSTPVVLNTNSPSNFYTDTTASLTDIILYKVAAINSYGTGVYSSEIYFPTKPDTFTNVLKTSDTNFYIKTSDTNFYILVNK